MKKILLPVLLAFTFLSYGQKSFTAKQIFKVFKVRQLGPALTSGRVTDIEMHPKYNNTIWVGTAGGGVWKSIDGGINFTSMFDKHNSSIGVVKLDPKNPDKVVWVGTGETWTRNSTSVGDGLYKSTDGGNNWKKIGFDDSERISAIVINPKNTDIVYVGILGHLWGDYDKRGVYKTTDGGKTWKKILAGLPDTGVSDIVMDPKNPDILYAAMWQFRRTPWSFNSGGKNSALYKTTDGGKTWKKIHNGFPKGKLGRIAIAVAPSNPKKLYAVIESEKDKDKGLYVSEDAGKHWKKTNGDFGITVRPFYFGRLVVDPKDENTVSKAGLQGYISRDGGKTFKTFGWMHSDIHDIAYDKDNSKRIYFATDGGFYYSWDRGKTLIHNQNLNVAQAYYVSVDNAQPYNIYTGLQDNGCWTAPSEAPGGIKGKDWTAIGYGDGFRAFRHPTKKIIYSEMQAGEGIWRYNQVKHQIRDIKPFAEKEGEKLRFNWNTALQISPNHPDRVYVGSQYLHRSDDMGDNWNIISPDLTKNDKSKQNQAQSGGLTVDNSGAENYGTIFTIAESPKNDQIIWIGTDDGNVQITKNGGKTWQNITANIPGLPENSWVYHIEASNFDEGTAYAVFDRHTLNDRNPYVYKTTDYGQTWKSLATPDIKDFARSIQEDFVNPDILYLGTEDGLYISLNGGKKWMKFQNDNMPTVPVHHVTLQRQTNDLVLATHGRGIIIIDDISPLREIKPELLQENVHFFPTPTFVMREREDFGAPMFSDSYVASNPTHQAKFIYSLKKRHTFGKMSMRILDKDGKEVVKLQPGKQKGLNKVNWNFRGKIPVSAKGKTFSFGSFVAPRYPAGKYTLELKKGKKIYTHDFETKYDDFAGIPLEERKIQEKTAWKLYDMIQDLAYLVYQIDEMEKYAQNLKKENPKIGKTANKLITPLENLKKDLVQTTGDNYTQTPEPELREKISKLYQNIVGEYHKPSNSQMKNLTILDSDLKEAHLKFDKIKKKYFVKLQKRAEKYKLPKFKIKSFDEFIKK